MRDNIYKKIEKGNFTFNSTIYENYKKKEGVIACKEGTDDEFILVPLWADDEFHITSVSREDFKAMGWDASGVSDEKMQWIADKMSSNYVGGGQFWGDVRFYAEELELPKIKKEEE